MTNGSINDLIAYKTTLAEFQTYQHVVELIDHVMGDDDEN